MGDVYDFYSGEKVNIKPSKVKREAVNVINSVHQRKNQIEDIMIIFIEKNTGRPVFLSACQSDWDRRALYTYFIDYMSDMSDFDMD